jgi:hypothetical protein
MSSGFMTVVDRAELYYVLKQLKQLELKYLYVGDLGNGKYQIKYDLEEEDDDGA